MTLLASALSEKVVVRGNREHLDVRSLYEITGVWKESNLSLAGLKPEERQDLLNLTVQVIEKHLDVGNIENITVAVCVINTLRIPDEGSKPLLVESFERNLAQKRIELAKYTYYLIHPLISHDEADQIIFNQIDRIRAARRGTTDEQISLSRKDETALLFEFRLSETDYESSSDLRRNSTY
jgi:hypothetical protein